MAAEPGLDAGGVAMADVGDIYRRDGEWLHEWLRRQTRCPQRAADLVQDTFFRLLERGHALPLAINRSYLVVVARRLLIDESRQQLVHRHYLEALAQTGLKADMLTPERILAAVQELAAIIALLSGLPDQVREAFLLRRLDGLPHGEIAGRLGISDRTVKRHIARAYEHLYNVVWVHP